MILTKEIVYASMFDLDKRDPSVINKPIGLLVTDCQGVEEELYIIPKTFILLISCKTLRSPCTNAAKWNYDGFRFERLSLNKGDYKDIEERRLK